MKHSDVKQIGIVGLGMIGDSISVLTTGHAYKTIAVVRRSEMIPEYQNTFKNYFEQMTAHDLMPANQGEICAKYITYTTDYEALSECEIIFECVTENVDLKQKIYAEIEARCPKVRVIC
jgi:3-hydroxybutyryl-CoA dehydrogenase